MVIDSAEIVAVVKELMADASPSTLKRQQAAGDYNPSTLSFATNGDLAPVGVKVLLLSTSGSNLTDFDQEINFEGSSETRYAILDHQGELNLADNIEGMLGHKWTVTGIRTTNPTGDTIFHKVRLQR